jgi:hypothetical protein
VLGVNGVTLADKSTFAFAGGTCDLDWWMTVAPKEPGQADPIGATPLDSEDFHRPERARPGEQVGVSGIGCLDDTRIAETAAQSVDRHGDVLIFVGVDADDDVAALKCDAVHDC